MRFFDLFNVKYNLINKDENESLFLRSKGF